MFFSITILKIVKRINYKNKNIEYIEILYLELPFEISLIIMII